MGSTLCMSVMTTHYDMQGSAKCLRETAQYSCMRAPVDRPSDMCSHCAVTLHYIGVLLVQGDKLCYVGAVCAIRCQHGIPLYIEGRCHLIRDCLRNC